MLTNCWDLFVDAKSGDQRTEGAQPNQHHLACLADGGNVPDNTAGSITDPRQSLVGAKRFNDEADRACADDGLLDDFASGAGSEAPEGEASVLTNTRDRIVGLEGGGDRAESARDDEGLLAGIAASGSKVPK